MFIQTTATKKILQLHKRIRGVAGGSSASKTVSILLWLIQYAQTGKDEVISVVSDFFPHLKRGAMRDFLNIMQTHHYFKDERWNRTDCIYQFESGSKIEFFSADQPGKVRGPRRDILFINEANNISYETFTQLEIRTKKIVWLDWNPVSSFWWYDEILGKMDCDFITLTYKDNEALDVQQIQTLEARKGNKNWWRIFGLGELGEIEGKIFTDWRFVNDIPQDARLLRYGLNFGYTNDPGVIVAIYKFNEWLILDEIVYRLGLHNNDLANILLDQAKHGLPALTVADSAEPKSIDEIRRYGVAIVPATKGPGSVEQGIDYVQQQKIAVTKRSLNIIKEYRNYLWQTDREGKLTKEPEVLFHYGMDAVRYGISSMKPMSKGADVVKIQKPDILLKKNRWEQNEQIGRAHV
jgi:phage terminase large subunit